MLDYFKGKGIEENWIITEREFMPLHLGKCESIMALGNGYVGVRSAHEENYPNQKRNTLIAGTFNKSHLSEPTELPNAADVIEMEFLLNGERFSLEMGTILFYKRRLSLKTGHLSREIVWESPKGSQYKLHFQRFISLNNKHLICQKVEITPLDHRAEIVVTSGINGQVTNDGTQHFNEGKKRVYNREVLEYIQTTTASNVDILLHSVHVVKNSTSANHIYEAVPSMDISRRKLSMQYHIEAKENQTYAIEKISSIHTSMDMDYSTDSLEVSTYAEAAKEKLVLEAKKGYHRLLNESTEAWADYWDNTDIKIGTGKSENFDQVASRFAQYHLFIMTPSHDHRFGIGAKGLTGEGYKGHSFWDSEIFIMPYFLYTQPDIARGLLKYRYLTLDGARKKAKENGFEGAMYPWESALTGDEETPVWGAVNVETGEQTKILSGFLEQHITGDIAYAVDHYYKVTNDHSFMEECGYEMIFETAKFWASRLEWFEEAQVYQINHVIGPDEYKEEVDNNAFTNYLAEWNIRVAMQYYRLLKQNNHQHFETLDKELNLSFLSEKWNKVVGSIYLPQPNEKGIIPQDDTYLDKKSIDIEAYKMADTKQTILKDYSREQVINMQISKQADVVMLLYLFAEKFNKDVKKKNWQYYESKTIHDSSLSMAVHGMVASDIGDEKKAYECFQKAASIDLGQNVKSSDAGIHAASLGGVWKSIALGFAGLKVIDHVLHINPHLPSHWEELVVPILWRGIRVDIRIDRSAITIEKREPCEEVLTFNIHGNEVQLSSIKSIAL